MGSDGTIYVGNPLDNTLYALDSDGSVKWQYAIGDIASYVGPSIGPDGTIYIGSMRSDCCLYAFNPGGVLKWRLQLGGYILSTPCVALNGIVYIGTVYGLEPNPFPGDNTLYAVNPDGIIDWTFKAVGWIWSSPCIDAEGTIYFASRASSRFYAITSTGSEKWSLYIQQGESSPALTSDGTIWVASFRRLYRIKELYIPPLFVDADIKPGSWPNPINKGSMGVIPVAICGTEEFDAMIVDKGTVQMFIEGVEEGVPPLRWSYEDAATPYVDETPDGHEEKGDGYVDLVLKFDTQEVVDVLGLCDYEDAEFVKLFIRSNLVEEEGGTPIEGYDWIRIQIPKGKGNK